LTPLAHVVFVLHRPRSMDNVGAVARVVKNFGVGRLVLVDPLSTSFDRARKLAVGAEDVLEHMFVHRTLDEALGEAVYSAGTSSRTLARRPSLSPSELGAKVGRCPGQVAVVFGEEKRGLSDDELLSCQEVCRIPTEPGQPSLNLAQSAAVLAFALHTEATPSKPIVPQSARATQRELSVIKAEARRALQAAGFLNPQNPELVLAELARCWERADLTPREAELWRSAFRKLDGALKRRSKVES
jgi:tRNA/rRNA methyltransferase